METEIIVISIIIPLIIGPLCIFLKSLYDRYNIKNDERKLVIFNQYLDLIQNKMKLFYWPLYLKLLCIYQMNFSLPLDTFETISSDSSQSEDGDDFIKYTKKRRKRCKGKYGQGIRCKKTIPKNSMPFCKKCVWNQKDEIIEKYINLNENNKNNKDIMVGIPKDIDVNITINSDNTRQTHDKSITGYGIGIVKELELININLDKETITKFNNIINETQKEILNIIEEYISIAEPNNKLGKHIILFIKYAKIKLILDESSKTYNISQFGTKDNTNKLLSLIETKLFDLQKEYKLLIKQGPYNDNIYNIVDYSSDSSSLSESSSISDNVTVV
jgi:hypothetical protein